MTILHNEEHLEQSTENARRPFLCSQMIVVFTGEHHSVEVGPVLGVDVSTGGSGGGGSAAVAIVHPNQR